MIVPVSQLAQFLAALHRPLTRARVEAAVGRLPEAHQGPQHPTSTQVLRDRFGTWVRPEQQLAREALVRLGGRRAGSAWSDRARARRSARRHQVWNHDELRLVVDFGTASAAEPEYDLRALPGTGPGIRTPTAWIHDLSTRFNELGIDPETPSREQRAPLTFGKPSASIDTELIADHLHAYRARVASLRRPIEAVTFEIDIVA